MIALTKVILASLLLVVVCCDILPIDVSDGRCPTDFSLTCDLQCPNGKYVLDGNGCPTCQCAKKAKVECSRVMCRMFCEHGFKRDENDCEYCACNSSPQPCPQLDCEDSCPNGYRKDYSGCPTCSCVDKPKETPGGVCQPPACNMACKYGFERDENGCEICSCQRCPKSQCRMYCMYGFQKNEDGCEICDCDWSPVAENIQCDERIPCSGTRVCNVNLRLCELVDPDRVNWFLYDFEVKNEDYLFEDEKFVQTFKNGLIHNIAAKYGLERTQITVSSVEKNGLTSFQIMPFFKEDMDAFEKKMDLIDIDLNSHEFRSLLPAVASTITDGDNEQPPSKVVPNKWCDRIKTFVRSRAMFFMIIFLFVLIAVIMLLGYIKVQHRYSRLSIRSDSKTPIYERTYESGRSDDYRYPVSAPDGTQYLVDSNDEKQGSNAKPTKV